ncbi:MAG: DNA primase, partial [Ketobacter sp.]
MAGRIPESFIDDVLARTDLVELIDSYVHLKRTGKNYSACCPFHQEKTPSFTVSPEKQFYYCFGCGASGNAIGFMMDYTRLGFVESIETLARNLGLEVPREEGAGQQREDYQPLYKALEAATSFYEQQLRNPKVKERPVNYLKSRGLSGETAKHFRLGYAPQGWDNLITTLGKSDSDINHLIKTGLLIENEQGRRYDRFRDRVMFPIRDSRGRVIAFGGRVMGNDKPKYLNSPETPVFHKGRELYGLYEAKQASNKIRR